MKSWRDEPNLIRQADEDDLQRVEVEVHWQRLFDAVEVIFVPAGGGAIAKAERAVLRGMMWQAKKRVAIDPAGARAYLVESLNMVIACMEVEPLEVYPDLKPRGAAVAT